MENRKPKGVDGEDLKFSYENCWKFIIRPPRDEYVLYELDFPFNLVENPDFIYIREDYTVLSKRGYLMECSFFRADITKRIPYIRPVVIYLHGNSSSRIEGTKMALFLLNKGIDLFVFDFPGCGKSEGEYISLGYYEKEDVSSIVDFVEKFPGVGKIGIWGRSMGAATALMYSYQDKRQHIYIPEFVINTILYFLKKTIRKKNDLEIENLKPIEFSKLSKTPAFFIHAMKDDLIPYEQTIKIYEEYSGIKSINITEGDHNTPRQKQLINKIITFFIKYLDENYKEEKNNFEESESSEESSEDENKINTTNKSKKVTVSNVA